MTTLVKKPLYESTSTGDDTPFVKFGLFDEDNYKKSELQKAKEGEKKYRPIRLVAGDVIKGVIAEVTQSKFGDVLTLIDVEIKRGNKQSVGERDEESEVKLGVSTDLKNKLAFKSKCVGDEVTIEYLGKHPSPKDATRSLHKVNLS